jgi:hypothetical protein
MVTGSTQTKTKEQTISISVTYDSRKFERAVKRLTGELSRLRRPYGQSSRAARDYVRGTITRQGRKRPYAKLSSWTKFKTNRHKALLSLRPRIKASWDHRSAEVYFDTGGVEYTATQHHRGYTTRGKKARGKKVFVVTSRSGQKRFFKSFKKAKTPAREIWPDTQELRKVVNPIFAKWVKNSARKTWR